MRQHINTVKSLNYEMQVNEADTTISANNSSFQTSFSTNEIYDIHKIGTNSLQTFKQMNENNGIDKTIEIDENEDEFIA